MCMTQNNLSELKTKQNCNRNKGFQGQFNYIAFVNLKICISLGTRNKSFTRCAESNYKKYN